MLLFVQLFCGATGVPLNLNTRENEVRETSSLNGRLAPVASMCLYKSLCIPTAITD